MRTVRRRNSQTPRSKKKTPSLTPTQLLTEERDAAQSELSKTRTELADARLQLKSTETKLDSTEAKLASTETALADARREVVEMRVKLECMATFNDKLLAKLHP